MSDKAMRDDAEAKILLYGEYAVRLIDLSSANGAEPIELVRGFRTVAHANAFARRYVRDSIERCRAPGMDAAAVLQAWSTFGEDAEVVGAGADAWVSSMELRFFAETPVLDSEERNWRVLDPRRLPAEEEEA